MPLEIVVPQMGESIVEATVAQWLKKPGEAVKAREALVELETDKVNQVIEADTDGVLTQILAEVGATVAVGQAIGVIEAGAAASQPPSPRPTGGLRGGDSTAEKCLRRGLRLLSCHQPDHQQRDEKAPQTSADECLRLGVIRQR